MNIGFLTLVVILILTVSIIPAYATIFQGKILKSDSITITFGNDEINYEGDLAPSVKKVELKSNLDSILVKNPIFRILGDSFSIKSFDDNIIIYGINKGTAFNFHTLIFVDNSIVKLNDNAEFSPLQIIQESNSKQITPKPNNLHILVQSPLTTFNAQDFKFDVKTFDKLKYSGNDFQNFFGKTDGIKITALTKNPEGKILYNQTGITKNGIYEGKIYVPENLWSSGWYTIEISGDGHIGTVQKIIKFYVAGQPLPKGGLPCPVGQTLVDGECV